MEKEMASAGMFYGKQQQSTFFMDEAQRRELMEQRINSNAEALAQKFMAQQEKS